MENMALISALIAAVVSLIGMIVTFIISKNQLRQQSNEMRIKERELESNQRQIEEEIKFKARELENLQKNLERDIEELRQSQMQSVIEKRLEAYPVLWSIHIRYETNWVYEKKTKDVSWAQKYINELNEFNVKYGLFISQALYEKFFELRRELYLGTDHADKETSIIPERSTQKIRAIVYGQKGKPGLSTIEKDDLGSYINVAVQKRK